MSFITRQDALTTAYCNLYYLIWCKKRYYR
jgi:hypothetical protein